MVYAVNACTYILCVKIKIFLHIYREGPPPPWRAHPSNKKNKVPDRLPMVINFVYIAPPFYINRDPKLTLYCLIHRVKV